MQPILHSIFLVSFFVFFSCFVSRAGEIAGIVSANNKGVEYATVLVVGSSIGVISDSTGRYCLPNLTKGTYTLSVSCIGFYATQQTISINENEKKQLNFDLSELQNSLSEVVISGSLKAVRRSESPVSMEVYTPAFFNRNPTPNLFEALQSVNGIRPQLNCNICNTGDIHINGLEGPYTMILIDGMPIVSSLSSVYGLSGIPNSLIERMEVVKGPASTLYGSEAVGGLINIITKDALTAPKFTLDFSGTSWDEFNTDIGFRFHLGQKVSVLSGINYFNFGKIVDKNNDGFTDVTLQNRLSIFQKWSIKRRHNRLFSLAARFLIEDRWGGETNWTKKYRGGDVLYGESIYTKRWELLGTYQLPFNERVVLSFSYNYHDQDSRYGTVSYIANQQVAFGQIVWDKKIKRHDMLIGAAVRFTYYDDNTPATASFDSLHPTNHAQKILLPGIFGQYELAISSKHKLLVGLRYDYHSVHGSIFTPRLAYKFSLNNQHSFRVNAGTGYRVVNIFTEDHAALTGARKVEIKSKLKPEQSYNINLNYLCNKELNKAINMTIDVSLFYTYFQNRILANYDLDPSKIIYDNLKGYAENKGGSLSLDVNFSMGLKLNIGATFTDVSTVQNKQRTIPVLTEKFSSKWAVSYLIPKTKITIDYTGSLYSPMRLPILGEYDPRAANSPWWAIQNIQLTFKGVKNVEFYGGMKNMFDWTPAKTSSFLIARSHDPYDKKVQYDSAGNVLRTAENPYGLTFDPSYVYAPNQGRRFYVGLRVKLW